MSGNHPLEWRDHKEMIAYAKQHMAVAEYRFVCPTCGTIRVLSGKYVRRTDFAAGKYRHCWHCIKIERSKPPPSHVKVRCARCRAVRQIKRESYRDKSYSKYCPACARLMAQKRDANRAWKQAASERLPETCNPTMDHHHPSGNRQYFCRHYDKCLDVCIAKNWPGFVCSQCTGGELEPMEQRMLPWGTITEILPDTV